MAEYSDFRTLAKFETLNIRNIQNYRVKIVSKFLQNTRSDSNFNQIYDYDYGMQGINPLDQG